MITWILPVVSIVMLGIAIGVICFDIRRSTKEYESQKYVATSTSLSGKMYVTCSCIKHDDTSVNMGFVSDDFILGDPSESELRQLRNEILEKNPEFKECVIIFFGKLRG